MSKILSCLFWKSKTKSFSKKENKSIESSSVETTGHIVEGSNYRHTVKSQIVLPLSIKNKAYLFNRRSHTAYVKGLPGLTSQIKQVKSYPVSPRNISLEDKGYLSDQNLYTMSKYNLHRKYSTSVVSTSTPQNSSKYCPRATLGSSEPFPFQIPKDVAPRQSLFYELRYGSTDDSELNENLKLKADEHTEGYNNPNTSGRNISQSSTYKHQLQNKENSESQNDKSNKRKTIHHVRPVGVQQVPRQSTLFKTPQADSSVISPNTGFVHHLQLKPKNNTPLLVTNEGKVLHPLKSDKVRTSLLRSGNETPPVRVSLVKPLGQEEIAQTLPVRRSIRRSSLRHSTVVYKDLEAENLNRSSLLSERGASSSFIENGEDLNMFPVMPSRNSIRRSSVRLSRVSKENNEESNSFPFDLTENQPVVYAVPVVPTRGRSKSLLQQSVKSLASKNQKEEPVIYRKNLRYSMDTDVFSAETRRRSVSPAPQGFVNMERGQPMLVSEVLNPITSLFISDLKNPPPKDPLTKPKEANVWVKPRRYSVQRSSVSKQPPSTRTKGPAYESSTPTSRPVPVQRRQSVKSRYKYQDESSSDESIVVYRKKSKQSAPRRSHQHAVYAAQMPNPVLPQHDHNIRNSHNSFPGKSEHQVDMAQTSSSNDICGLTLGSDQKIFENLQSPYHVKMVSSAQQTDIENDLDLMCYPYENVLKKSVVASESGSKLRWRIIIKRGEEK